MKKIAIGMILLAICQSVFGATAGSCEAEATALSGTKTVKLTAEYDPDDGTYNSDSGVYYFKATLQRSNGYTVWTTGLASGTDVTLGCSQAEASASYEGNYPSADFIEVSEAGGNQRYVMYASDWYIDDEDASMSDPRSWVYYFKLEGTVGESVTVNFSKGTIVPQGRAENPRTISPTTNASTVNANLEIDGEYYFTARLTAGRLYAFGTDGGTATTPLAVTMLGAEDAEDVVVYADPSYDTAPYDSGIFVTVDKTATYYIVVDTSGEDNGAAFRLINRMVPARAAASHNATVLSVDNGYSATFEAGYKCNIFSTGYYDEIIDESLFSITAEKGARYVAQTIGAQTNLLMRVYKSNGDKIGENTAESDNSLNVRYAFEVPTAGRYYIGVCQNLYDEFAQTPAYLPVTLKVTDISTVESTPDEWDPADDTADTATGLTAVPGTESDDPEKVDVEGHGWHALGTTDWADTFVIAARKGITYRFSTTIEDETAVHNRLYAEVFTLSGKTERALDSAYGDINPGEAVPLTFTASANSPYYIRISVAEGQGLDYPNYKVHSMAYTTSGAELGILTVNTPGAPSATWSLGSESVKYPSGSSVLVSGTQTIKFSTVSGYKAAVPSMTVTVNPGAEPTVVEVKYSDTFDPKDDAPAGRTGTVSHAATALSFKNTDTEYAKRTLWDDDPEDNFAITGADGYFYDIALRNVEGDDVTFSITNAEMGVIAENVSFVTQVTMPKTKSKYLLTVKNGDKATVFGGYSLHGKFANVGAIKFARTAVSAKENAASVAVTVNRTAKDGVVRVRYGTVADTAKPGEDYVAQNGVLEWADGDNKAKTITVKLIPDLVPVYEGNKTFSIQLKALEDDERAASEYPASIVGGDTCTVTLTETSRATDTVESAYAKVAPKLATVKTETVPLETGTFYGVLAEDGSALTNGLPQLASVTLTASVPTSTRPSKLSAKVALAGKTYTFSGEGWEYGGEEGTVEKELFLVQKLNRISEETGRTVSVTVTNTLSITIASGATDDEGSWLASGGTATLVMNVPDANNKGYQEEIHYTGALYRQNAKIQDYLTAVTNFTGYYTVALVAPGVDAMEAPAGNGYITLTIDNKGAVKAAGALADGTTKPSLSVAACAMKEDESSANGYSMYVPLFFARSPVVFGGVIRLYADESGEIVVDSTRPLVWNNDNGKLTYYGENGYRLSLDPAGGWYDKVVNLQAYYLTRAFEVSAPDASEFFTEALTANSATKDYHFVDAVQPNGSAVDLAGDAFATAKKTLVRSGTLYDLAASANPCNVQVKLARATGLVTGTFSLWSENDDGSKQKEISGFKHFGVLVINRDTVAPLDDEIVCAGFCTQAVKVGDYNETTKRTTTRSITASLPFNLLGVDQGEPDWWADDWGEPE